METEHFQDSKSLYNYCIMYINIKRWIIVFRINVYFVSETIFLQFFSTFIRTSRRNKFHAET